MRPEIIKQFSVTCPTCNTSIAFEVLPGEGQITKLLNVSDNLECPRCKESLAYNTRKAVEAICEHNTATAKLIALAESTGVKLG